MAGKLISSTRLPKPPRQRLRPLRVELPCNTLTSIVPPASSATDYKNRRILTERSRAQELCESPGGRHPLPVPTGPYGHCGRKAALNDEVRYRADMFLEQLRQGWVGVL